uniref:Uncharacterized protein n=2 Tax=Oryza sativa subsp. japonica TaxID=39947 RepID=Q2R5Z7_ORYSJ|nr:hypothetical protein LOC_Os11g22800 [Oryza sativa Japonica Group]ABA93067.1 hypothetical protein LOC_Os11g22800 [Oryza sativa Japonica Group]
MAGLHLAPANPMESTATEGDDGRRQTARLKMEQIGFTVTTVLRWLASSRRWLPGFSSLLRCRQWIRRGPATTESTAKLRRRSKHGNGSAFTVTATSGGVRRKRTGGWGRARLCGEVVALTGDGRGDGEWRLERRPEVEREGERGESVSGDGGRRDLRG